MPVKKDALLYCLFLLRIAISFILGIAVVPLAIIFEKYASDLIITESYKYILWAGIEEICKS